MKYAEMHDGEIVKIHHFLPRGWRNIGNFFKIEEEKLTDLSWSGNPGRGFWKVVSGEVPQFNPATHKVSETTVIDTENSVVRTQWNVVPLSEEELLFQQNSAQYEDQSVWSQVRMQRNQLLSSSDWSVMPDSPLTPEKREEWITYRQQLRDIPQTFTDASAVVYPPTPN
jgi:hypothetical protein